MPIVPAEQYRVRAMEALARIALSYGTGSPHNMTKMLERFRLNKLDFGLLRKMFGIAWNDLMDPMPEIPDNIRARIHELYQQMDFRVE